MWSRKGNLVFLVYIGSASSFLPDLTTAVLPSHSECVHNAITLTMIKKFWAGCWRIHCRQCNFIQRMKHYIWNQVHVNILTLGIYIYCEILQHLFLKSHYVLFQMKESHRLKHSAWIKILGKNVHSFWQYSLSTVHNMNYLKVLSRWGLVDILQTAFSNAFSRKKFLLLWIRIKLALVQLMVWHRTSDKPLTQPMWTEIYGTDLSLGKWPKT